jgi:glutamate/aspartate transport system substrate-binding protein
VIRLLTSVMLAVLVASPTLGAELESTLKKVKETNSIVIGYREASRPFSFVGDDGKPVGYSIDLCLRIVAGVQQQLGLNDLQVKWVPVTPENRIPLLVKGAIDIECGSTTNSLSRQEQVDFSNMIFVDGGSLLVKADSGIRGIGDLGGKRVGVIPGTTTEKALAASLQKRYLNAKLIKVKDHNEGLALIESGEADAYASDEVILVGLALTARDPAKLRLGEQYFSYEPYGLMLRRGDPDFRLAVNRVLSRLYRSDQIFEIFGKWFGNLGKPSGLLQAMYILHGLPE